MFEFKIDIFACLRLVSCFYTFTPIFHASFFSFSGILPHFSTHLSSLFHTFPNVSCIFHHFSTPSLNYSNIFSYVTTHFSLFCTEIFYFQIFLFHTLLTNLNIPFSPLLTLFWQNHQSSPISIIFSTLLRPIQQSKVNLCQI